MWLLDRGRSVAVDSQSGGVLYLTRWSTSLALVLVEIPTTVNPTLVAELRLLRGLVVTLLKRRDDSGDRRDLEDSCD